MNIDPVSASANVEVQVNDALGVLDWSAVYGYRASTSSGLTWGYYGGRWSGFALTAATLTLTNTADNYIVVARADGAISVSTGTTNWNDLADYARVYKVTCAGGVVTATEDHRAGEGGIISGAPVDSLGTMAQQDADDVDVTDGVVDAVIGSRTPKHGTFDDLNYTGELTSASLPAFLVQVTSAQNNIAVDTIVTVVWNTERFDQGSDFASNTFTAPVTGKYQFNLMLYMAILLRFHSLWS